MGLNYRMVGEGAVHQLGQLAGQGQAQAKAPCQSGGVGAPLESLKDEVLHIFGDPVTVVAYLYPRLGSGQIECDSDCLSAVTKGVDHQVAKDLTGTSGVSHGLHRVS